MSPVYLFDLASRHVSWASFRQTVVTSNIANANTPGYIAQDVKPFADVLDSSGLEMARTSSAHLASDDVTGSVGGTTEADPWQVTDSGNSVSLEQEMIKADEVNRTMSLDLTIERAFQRMILTSVRSGS